MYNHVTGPGAGGSGLLSLQLPQGENSTTPRTPEILNSLIAMTNPFESSYRAHAPRLASSPPGGSDTSTSSSGSPGCMSPPSVQHTCSQLIKEGLKLTIQSKRRSQGGSHASASLGTQSHADEVSGALSLGDDDDDDPFSPRDGLTPEDEERRRRRRERNKIAATKCRLKKRERTVNLVQESEILENQNLDLKSQIQELETQRRRLMDMLSVHKPSCTKPQTFVTSDNSAPYPPTPFQYPRGTVDSSNMFRRMNMTFPRTSTSVSDTTMSYRRVEMTSASCAEPYQRMETVIEENVYCQPTNESTGYHSYELQENKNDSLLVPYCRTSVINSVESPPSFTRIGEQYSCQNIVSSDMFVKPELPSMAGFHSPVSSYGRPPSIDINSSVSPNYDSVNSPALAVNTYQQFEEESNTFASGFSSVSVDRSCIT